MSGARATWSPAVALKALSRVGAAPTDPFWWGRGGWRCELTLLNRAWLGLSGIFGPGSLVSGRARGTERRSVRGGAGGAAAEFVGKGGENPKWWRAGFARTPGPPHGRMRSAEEVNTPSGVPPMQARGQPE